MGKDKYIEIKGARANNLKNIDVKIPQGKFVAITGVSGSGKSSLAFDTLYAEGHASLYFFHSFHFPSGKLDDDFMQCRALAQDFYSWCFGIPIDLFYCFLPLCLGFCLEILGWQHLQFDDVAMLGRIVG